MKFTRAFTLIEILLVTAIAAGIFAFSAPLAFRLYKTQLVEEARSNIIMILKQARHNAILQKNDSDFGVKINNDDDNFILFQGETYATRDDSYDEVYDLLTQIVVTGETEIVFNKHSGDIATTSTTTLTYSPIVREILVEEYGTISKVAVATEAPAGPEVFAATGGTITYTDSDGANPRSSPSYAGGYTVHTFLSGTNTFTVTSGSTDIDLLVVAGGGGGHTTTGGGGGAGGLISTTTSVSVGETIVVVGSGGTPGNNGNPSSFGGLTAFGGGKGARDVWYDHPSNVAAGSGGSGGGGAWLGSSGGTGTSGQGRNGGAGYLSDPTYYNAGGGGGYSAVGQAGSTARSGNGGAGISLTISGISVGYAGGGGGGADSFRSHTAGTATYGGGNGGYNHVGYNGTANTGGGGGGGSNNTAYVGGSGGSGVVIIRYLTP